MVLNAAYQTAKNIATSEYTSAIALRRKADSCNAELTVRFGDLFRSGFDSSRPEGGIWLVTETGRLASIRGSSDELVMG